MKITIRKVILMLLKDKVEYQPLKHSMGIRCLYLKVTQNNEVILTIIIYSLNDITSKYKTNILIYYKVTKYNHT